MLVVVYPLQELLTGQADKVQPPIKRADDDADPQELCPATIAEVMKWARERVAEIAGVSVDAVRLELKLES